MFKFIEKLEREVADFLIEYNRKAWGLRGRDKLEDFLLSDDEENVLSYYNRGSKEDQLLHTLELSTSRLDRIEAKEILFDEIDLNREKLEQIRKILGNIRRLDLYKKWRLDEIIEGVNLKLIPTLKEKIYGADLEWVLNRARNWALGKEEKQIAAAVIWITDKEVMGTSRLTNLKAVRLLQKKWNIYPGWKADSTAERRIKEIKSKYRKEIPKSPC